LTILTLCCIIGERKKEIREAATITVRGHMISVKTKRKSTAFRRKNACGRFLFSGIEKFLTVKKRQV